MKKFIILSAFIIGFMGNPKAYAQDDQFIGQIAAIGFNFAPIGWLKCEGQLLQISQYDALFALIGTTYGGDGQNTFALPDYRGRTLVGVGQAPGLSNYNLGQQAGSNTATLTVNNLPSHAHAVGANTGAGTTSSPTNNVYANTGALDKEYSPTSNGKMQNTGSTGANTPTPVDIRQPSLGVTYIIAVEGIFPSRN